jgi:hypothetical protein
MFLTGPDNQTKVRASLAPGHLLATMATGHSGATYRPWKILCQSVHVLLKGVHAPWSRDILASRPRESTGPASAHKAFGRLVEPLDDAWSSGRSSAEPDRLL